MQLQGRDLKVNMRGDDVKLLQKELRELAFPIDDEDGHFGATTRRAVLGFQEQHLAELDLPKPTGMVDEATALLINAEVDARQSDSFVVKGVVRYEDGKPFTSGLVVAFDKDMRDEEQLGKVNTDSEGRYEITYTADQFQRSEKKSADLRVCAYADDGSELASSPIIFNAQPVETVDLAIPAGVGRRLSEYERYVAELTPVMQDVPFTDLTDDDITFLTGETEILAPHIAFLASGHLLSRETKLPPEIFYGGFRAGLPTNLSGWLVLNSRALRDALERAIHGNIIPARFRDQLDAVIASLQQLIGQFILRPTDENAHFTLGELLDASLLSRNQQENFLRLYIDREGSIEDFWNSIRENPAFQKDGQVDDLQFTLQLGLITQNNARLVKLLKAGNQQDPTPTSLRDLARNLDATALAALVDGLAEGEKDGIPPRVSGETKEERRENYVNEIIETLKAAFPTTFVERGLARQPQIDIALVKQVLTLNPNLDPSRPLSGELDWGKMEAAEQARARTSLEALRQEIKAFPAFDYRRALGMDDNTVPSSLENPIRKGVARFLKNEPGFEFADTHIDSYLTDRAEGAFNGIPEADRAAVTDQLKSLQRVYRVTARYEHMEALMREGLTSAYAISRIPQKVFASRFAESLGGEARAKAIQSQAKQITATNTNVYASVYQSINDVTPYVISGANAPIAAKSGSPISQMSESDTAAAAPMQANSNWQSLFGAIALCDCEHCRSVYSPAAYFVDTLQFLNESDKNSNGKTPLDVLSLRRPDLEHIKLTCENTNTLTPYVDLANEILEYYVAHGELNAGSVKNTEGITAEELSVNPQYKIDEAYTKLKQGVYPFTLPFNRPLELARVYLEHLGSTRHQVMETFQTDTDPSDPEIASEYLKISPETYPILTGGANNPLGEFYGYDVVLDSDWDMHIAHLPEFLARTAIQYGDLIDLLGTRFLNLNQTMTIAYIVDPNGNESEPIDLCDLSKLKIENLTNDALDKFHRFIRLWRILGWSIADLDKVCVALGATAVDDDLIRKLAQVKRLHQELNLPLVALLSLWSNIDTYGDDALYNKLFLYKAVLYPVDAALALNAAGTELASTSETISQHLPGILAAFRINEGDLTVLRAATGLADENAALNLAHLSRLYCHALLARALKLKVSDLVALKALSGLDPFQPGDPAPTVVFVESARKARDSDFSVAQLNYLYRNLSEPVKPIAPSQEQVLRLAKQLHDGLKQIADDNRLAPDPTGELTRNKLGDIWEDKIVDRMISTLNGSSTYSASLASLPAITVPDEVKNKLSYDSTAQMLRFVGPMTLIEQVALKTISSDGNYQAAIDNLFQQPRDFLSNTKAGFLDLAEAPDRLLDNPNQLLDDPQQFDDPALIVEKRLGYVLERLLPYLRDTLSRSFVKQTLGEALILDSAITDLLLEKLLKSPVDINQPLMADCLAMVDSGLAGTYFNNADLSGAGLLRIDPTIDFDWGAGSPDPAIGPGAFSARWTGKLIAPNNGDYTFHVRASDGIRLRIDGQSLIDQWQAQPLTEHSAPIQLRAGQLYGFELEYARWASDAVIELQWSSPSTPKAILPQDALLPGSTHDAFVSAFSLLHKASLLVNSFEMTPKELAYLSAHGMDFKGVDPSNPANQTSWVSFNLNELFNPAGSTPAHFNQWERLYDVFNLRDSLPQREVDLIDAFQAASQSTGPNILTAGVSTALIEATGWGEAELTQLTGSDGYNLTDADFKNEQWPFRLQACMKLGRRIGISTAKLFDWARNDPDANQAEDIIHAVKAKYSDEHWLTVGKPLNDALRDRQKEALVAHVLAQANIVNEGITNSDQLFEYFLLDVNMTSCMNTSRIKQASSSVQLFIQRCLMNLEDRGDNHPATVKPTAIDDARWKWMKNYRVWEANRKVFLYPENWIEPELRDNKTPIFKELESELLQDDVTTESAERVFLNYLEKLDEVTRLEMVGMYWQKKEAGEDTDILHAFGRTFNPPHIYYYRRLLVSTGIWTAWEKVALDIQGDDEGGGVHLVPVVYNRRLYLFWPIFKKKTNQETDQAYWEIQLAWSEYQHQRWTGKHVSTTFTPSAGGSRLAHFFTQDVGETLSVSVWYGVSSHPQNNPHKKWLVLNPSFELEDCKGKLITQSQSGPPGVPFNVPENSEFEYMSFAGSEPLTLVFSGGVLMSVLGNAPSEYHVLPDKLYNFLAPHSPFFYQDRQRVYCVLPKLDKRKIVSFASTDSVVVDTSLSASVSKIQVHSLLDSTISLQSGAALVSADGHLVAPVAGQQVMALAKSSSGGDMIEVGGGAVSGYIYDLTTPLDTYLEFAIFYHPDACAWIKTLNQKGIPGLLTLRNQMTFILAGHGFKQWYAPTSKVHPEYPKEVVDFDHNGAYSLYNWELFFHSPMLIATRLSQNQRFEEAQKWFHYIFNPTDSSADPPPRRYWKVLPFYNNTDPEHEQIQTLLALLSKKDSDLTPEQKKRKAAFSQQVEEWRDNPFNPHFIARMRMTAYQKNVVMKYIDNLIAWGDQLFNRDTIESINEATQLYVLAANMLGSRPERISSGGNVQTETYATLKSRLDSFSNAQVQMETDFIISNSSSNGGGSGAESLELGTTFYFCIPRNDKLLKYWDTVADRLFKIRHCMNIEGVVRQLPLFEPPIDPALLVRAFAKGIDISSVLNDINAPLPNYRFIYMLQRALGLCNELKSLGNALLSALEKKNAEELAALRASHESSLLKAAREVKQQQIDEAKFAREGLEKTREITDERYRFFRDVEFLNAGEIVHFGLSAEAAVVEAIAEGLHASAAGLHVTTTGYTGALGGLSGGPIKLNSEYSGRDAGSAEQAIAAGYSIVGKLMREASSLAATMGSYERRWDDWKLQEKLGKIELQQIDKQIAAAEIREAIAQAELDNHEKQMQQATVVEEFLRDKYTNDELYSWMVGQTSGIYFQAYKLAYDVAKRAERAYRFELGLTDSNFIQFGYWDSLRKGLLAGERLHLDLMRMESAYHENNKREYEITQHFSLALLDAKSLVQLRETGECEFSIPELAFDISYPGHYLRRIKSVSVSVPCVTGPYANVSARLTLLKNRVRVSGSSQQDYAYTGIEDSNFRHDLIGIQSIATSTGQNDSGLFQFNFQDERYLPFERAGAISNWRLSLPNEFRTFDYGTISDVILHLSYTAREGGDALRGKVETHTQQAINRWLDEVAEEGGGLFRLISLKHEFSSQLHHLLFSAEGPPQATVLPLTRRHFPYFLRGRDLTATRAMLIVKPKDGQTIDSGGVTVTLNGVAGSAFAPLPDLNGLAASDFTLDYVIDPEGASPWELEVSTGTLDPEAVGDLYLLVTYTVATSS
jgi:Tc toxin complex TcA C-terminal TcB-binding domain/ABC toxin N-terminal region/Neuraminidase-like domain/PA14 domain/Putative peptidoglycan binding domain/Salmonella virulence plasmid 28.1kDa A protein